MIDIKTYVVGMIIFILSMNPSMTQLFGAGLDGKVAEARAELTRIGPAIDGFSTYAAVFNKADNAFYGLTRDSGPAYLYKYLVDKSIVDFQIPIPEAEGGWCIEYADGKYYIATYKKSILLSFCPVTKQLKKLAELHNEDSYIWSLDIINNDTEKSIYLGTSPRGNIYKYDINTEKLSILFSVYPKWSYVRSLKVHGDKVYAGVGSPANLIVYDKITKIYSPILPNNYLAQSYVYHLFINNNTLIASLSPSHDLLAFDILSGKVSSAGRLLDMPIKIPSNDADDIIFRGISDMLIEYNFKDNTAKRLSLSGLTGGYYDPMDKTFSGFSRMGIYTKIHIPTNAILKKIDLLTAGFKSSKVRPFSIAALAGKVYVGEKRLRVFDAHKFDQKIYVGNGEAKCMRIVNDKLFVSTYADAKVYGYPLALINSSEKIDLRDEQWLVFDIENEQYRPTSISSSPDGHYLAISTNSYPGVYGGGITVIDLQKYSGKTIRNILNKHAVGTVNFLNNSILIVGTNVFNEGILPLKEDARLLAYDVKSDDVIYEITPRDDNQVIGSIATLSGKIFISTQNGDILVFDSSTGTKIAEVLSLRIRNIFSTSDGKLYAYNKSSLYSIDPDSYSYVILGRGFKDLFGFAEDPISGEIYLLDGSDLVRFIK